MVSRIAGGIIKIVPLVCVVIAAILVAGCTGAQVVTPTPQIIYVTVTPEPTQTQYTSPTNNNAITVENYTIKKGYYMYDSIVLDAYHTVNVSVTTNGNKITFLIMDESNFDKYDQVISSGSAGTWNNYVCDNGIVQKTYTFTPPSTGKYYFIMDNTGEVKNSIPVTGPVNVHFTMT